MYFYFLAFHTFMFRIAVKCSSSSTKDACEMKSKKQSHQIEILHHPVPLFLQIILFLSISRFVHKCRAQI